MSLKSLARELGVSTAAVSYALNNKGNISPELRARILEAAKAKGYELSPVAQALRGKRLKILGLMISSVYDEMGQGFFTGVDRAVQEAGYSTILSINSPAMSALDSETSAVRRFQALQISGVLYVPSANSDPLRVEAVLREANLPFVLLYRSLSSDPSPSVTVDHAEGFRLALDHLHLLGHRRIGFVYSRDYRGPEVDVARKVFEKRCPGRSWAKWSAAVEGDDFQALLRQTPTAIFTSSDDVAASVFECLESAGLRVPDDVSLVGFRDTKVAQLMRPSLTTVHVPTETIGYEGGLHLLALIEPSASASPQPLFRELPLALKVRQSTSPPK